MDREQLVDRPQRVCCLSPGRSVPGGPTVCSCEAWPMRCVAPGHGCCCGHSRKGRGLALAQLLPSEAAGA